MGILGDWIAQILVDTSKIGPSLSSAKSEWADYYSYIQKKDDETTKYIKKALTDVGKAEAASRQEALESYKSLTAEEKKQVDARVKSYNTASIAIDQNRKKLEDLRLQVLKYASIAISVPITFMFDQGLKEYLAFVQQMQNIKAVVGATNADLQMLSDTAVAMSEKFSSSPVAIAKAMFDLGQAGLEANEIYKQIGPVMTLAAAGMKDVSFTAEMVVTTLKAFQLSSEDAGRVADIFATSNAKSVSSLDKLSASLKYTAGLWSSMGWSIEELVGTLDTLYDTGVRGEKAGRLLASAINGLQRPSAGASKAINNLLGYTSALDPAFNNIEQIIGKLAAAHATTQDVVKIFGKESAEVINRLIQNYSLLDGNVKEVTGNMGESARQAAIQMDNLNGKMNIMKNTFTNVTKSFASTLDPALKGVVTSFTSVLQMFEKAPNPVKALTVSIIGTVAVMFPLAAGFLTVKVALAALSAQLVIMGTTLAATLGPFAIASAAISGLVALYITAKRSQQDWIDSVDSGMSQLEKQGKSVDDMVDSLGALGDSIEDQKKSKAILEELAAVFPKLREQLNKNADDTASAMAALRSEYGKLKLIEADRLASVTAPSYLEQQLASERTKVAELSSEYGILAGNAGNFISIKNMMKGKSDFVGITNIDQFADYISKSKTNLDKVLALDTNGLFTPWIVELKNVNDKLDSAKADLKGTEQFAKNLGSDSANNKLKVSTKLVEQIYSLTSDMTNKVWSLRYDLQLKNKTATASDVANVIGGVFDDAIKNITLDNQIDMMSLGLMKSDSTFTDWYKNKIAEMGSYTTSEMNKYGSSWAEHMMSKFDADVKTSTSFDTLKELLDGLSKYQALKIDVGVETDPKKISDLNTQLSNMDSAFGGISATSEKGLTDNQKAIREIVKAYLAWGVAMSENFGDQKKGGKETLDWWEQIIEKTKDAEKQLNGYADADPSKNITSLNKKVKELATLTGNAKTEVQGMADRLKSAFEQNPELKSIAGLSDLNNVAELTKIQLDAIAIAMAKAYGIPVNVAEYNNQLASLTKTKEMMIVLQSATEKGSAEWMIYQNSIDKTNEAMLELAGNAGAITNLSFKSSKFSSDNSKRIKELNDLSDAYKDLANSSVEEMQYMVENIDPNKGLASIDDSIKTENMFTAIEALEELNNISDEYKKKRKELDDQISNNTITEAEATEQTKKLGEAEKDLETKKTITIEAIITGADDVLSGVSGIISSFKDMKEAFADTEASIADKAVSVGESITSIGQAISLINPKIGGIIAIIGVATNVIASMFSLLETEATEIPEKVETVTTSVSDILTSAVSEASESVADSYEDVGVALGKKIADGIANGTTMTSDDVASSMKSLVFDMMSTALVTISGFDSKISEIAETIWNELSPSTATASNLQEQISSIFSTSGYKTESAMKTALSSLKEQLAAINAANAKALATAAQSRQVATIQDTSVITGQITQLTNYISAIDELQSKIDALGTGITGTISDESKAAISEAGEELSALLEEVYSALEMTTSSSSEIISSLAESLTSAALTGSFSDFKQAVYKQIVSSITDAVILSSGVKTRISSLVSSIMEAGTDFSSDDAQSMLAEIRSIWTEVTDSSTPLGSVMMSLRDALSDFGLLDISVNPGTVVSAIPSDVRDDLIEAIKGTMDTLSQAITEAGLNSSINTVNITTAYITAMSATAVTIAQANMSVSGGLVMQVQTGALLESWLEDWFAAYLKKSGG
jgi:TP901 family phage tail tape measure protein